jgi:hypothetical protein
MRPDSRPFPGCGCAGASLASRECTTGRDGAESLSVMSPVEPRTGLRHPAIHSPEDSWATYSDRMGSMSRGCRCDSCVAARRSGPTRPTRASILRPVVPRRLHGRSSRSDSRRMGFIRPNRSNPRQIPAQRESGQDDGRFGGMEIVARACAGLHWARKGPENAVPRGLTPVRWKFAQRRASLAGKSHPAGFCPSSGLREADRGACTVPFVR